MLIIEIAKCKYWFDGMMVNEECVLVLDMRVACIRGRWGGIAWCWRWGRRGRHSAEDKLGVTSWIITPASRLKVPSWTISSSVHTIRPLHPLSSSPLQLKIINIIMPPICSRMFYSCGCMGMNYSPGGTHSNTIMFLQRDEYPVSSQSWEIGFHRELCWFPYVCNL